MADQNWQPNLHYLVTESRSQIESNCVVCHESLRNMDAIAHSFCEHNAHYVCLESYFNEMSGSPVRRCPAPACPYLYYPPPVFARNVRVNAPYEIFCSICQKQATGGVYILTDCEEPHPFHRACMYRCLQRHLNINGITNDLRSFKNQPCPNCDTDLSVAKVDEAIKLTVEARSTLLTFTPRVPPATFTFEAENTVGTLISSEYRYLDDTHDPKKAQAADLGGTERTTLFTKFALGLPAGSSQLRYLLLNFKPNASVLDSFKYVIVASTEDKIDNIVREWLGIVATYCDAKGLFSFGSNELDRQITVGQLGLNDGDEITHHIVQKPCYFRNPSATENLEMDFCLE